ncbi:MAG: hypothetical protein JRF41_04965 [Deltaproteobacteria bacterium]|nr:hypothetical protein [Deltaproteobacteria bacterium]
MSYGKHTAILWDIRDLFGQIFERLLSFVKEESPPFYYSDELRQELDDIFVDYCAQFGFASQTIQNILDEEYKNPGMPHP